MGIKNGRGIVQVSAIPHDTTLSVYSDASETINTNDAKTIAIISTAFLFFFSSILSLFGLFNFSFLEKLGSEISDLRCFKM